ncbi:alpha/beta fold hydrolase [Ochrobactrum teleogrylli]|uniref:alpha/beta fold hydrolase n=1 Tax=Ochrobactrum teleogrylli TaxID=2479765 RepID=UPI00384DF417
MFGADQPSTLSLWGPQDGYMPADSARAYRRDLPDAEVNFLEEVGHWLLGTYFDEALPIIRGFLARMMTAEKL